MIIIQEKLHVRIQFAETIISVPAIKHPTPVLAQAAVTTSMRDYHWVLWVCVLWKRHI